MSAIGVVVDEVVAAINFKSKVCESSIARSVKKGSNDVLIVVHVPSLLRLYCMLKLSCPGVGVNFHVVPSVSLVASSPLI